MAQLIKTNRLIDIFRMANDFRENAGLNRVDAYDEVIEVLNTMKPDIDSKHFIDTIRKFKTVEDVVEYITNRLEG